MYTNSKWKMWKTMGISSISHLNLVEKKIPYPLDNPFEVRIKREYRINKLFEEFLVYKVSGLRIIRYNELIS